MKKKNGHEKVANAIIPGILAPEADNTYKDLDYSGYHQRQSQ